MAALRAVHGGILALLSSRWVEAAALLLARLALAGVFWRSGRSKIAEGTWFTISDGTRYLFTEEYSAVPIPPAWAAPMATMAEHVFPILLLAGLATRFSALALLSMTMVIQIFVFPEAWWPVHSLWAALALILMARGGGLFSLDALVRSKVRP